MEQWIESEYHYSDYGDKRLTKRYKSILNNLSHTPKESIPCSSGGWGETLAVYRFLNNEKVSFDKILAGHKQATLERIKNYNENVILAVQDTTSIDLTGHRSSQHLGNIENSNHRGLFIHPTLAITPNRVNLGIIDVQKWIRDISTLGKKKDRKTKKIEDKESYRWLLSYQSADKLAGQIPGKTVVSVGDREYDIYEAFAAATSESSKAKILIRAAQNRKLALSNAETSLLWEHLENSKELGEKELIITQTKQHQARTAILSITAQEVTLKAPYRKGEKLSDITLNAILVTEKSSPSDKDKIEWLLLTTLEVKNISDALSVIDYYSCRWQIEMYFRVLKGGCEVEKLQLEQPESIENALAIYMVISWRIQYLLMYGRECPNLPSDLLFSEEEWKSIYIIKDEAIPDTAPPLNLMIIMIASLGGYLNRKNDSPPGVKTFWTGMVKLKNYAHMYAKMIKRKDVYN